MNTDRIPDARDRLTHEKRIVPRVAHGNQKKRSNRDVPTTMGWGRVCEYFYVTPADLPAMRARLSARR